LHALGRELQAVLVWLFSSKLQPFGIFAS
jgi:hypothetical protein